MIDTSSLLKNFVTKRKRDAERLQYKLSKVPRWQKRLAKVTDATVETLASERLSRLESLLMKEGITISSKGSEGSFLRSDYMAILNKGTVVWNNLSVYINVRSDGCVICTVYDGRSSHVVHNLVYKIRIGKKLTIANMVLPSLVARPTLNPT